MKRTSWGTGIAAAAALAIGCGGGGPGTSEQAANQPLQPLAVGSTWTYRTSSADGTDLDEKTSTVIAVEEEAGLQATVVETRRPGKTSQVWLAEVDGRIVRLREETYATGATPELRRFEPGSLRTPATLSGLRVGQTLPSVYTEVVLDESDRELSRVDRAPVWTVEALDDEVETPAGRFGAIRLRRSGDEADGSVEKLIWYAPGVGKVKEQGNRIELLESYRIAE